LRSSWALPCGQPPSGERLGSARATEPSFRLRRSALGWPINFGQVRIFVSYRVFSIERFSFLEGSLVHELLSSYSTFSGTCFISFFLFRFPFGYLSFLFFCFFSFFFIISLSISFTLFYFFTYFFSKTMFLYFPCL
jgi:hypothetical protein